MTVVIRNETIDDADVAVTRTHATGAAARCGVVGNRASRECRLGATEGPSRTESHSRVGIEHGIVELESTREGTDAAIAVDRLVFTDCAGIELEVSRKAIGDRAAVLLGDIVRENPLRDRTRSAIETNCPTVAVGCIRIEYAIIDR